MGTVDLNELKVYQLAMRVGEDVWSLTVGWDLMAKQTVGLHWIRAADSIATHLSEACGSSFAKENVRSYSSAMGSLRLTQTWLEKATSRGLVIHAVARELALKIDALKRQLDHCIASYDHDLTNSVRETSRDGSIHLLPLEELFHPRPSSRNN
jgi:four helix bundle protein